jgi:hypothetical protein
MLNCSGSAVQTCVSSSDMSALEKSIILQNSVVLMEFFEFYCVSNIDYNFLACVVFRMLK